MELMILVGVWALAFGHVSLSASSHMRGKQARIFGLLLIAAAAYAFPHLNAFAGKWLPKFVESNEAFRAAYGLLIGAIAIHITNYVVHTAYPMVLKQVKKAA